MSVDIFAEKLSPTIKLKLKGSSMNAIAIQGNLVVLSRESKLHLYDRGGEKFQELCVDREMHQGDITWLGFHPNHHNFLFSADSQGTINIFELKHQIINNMIKLSSPLDEMFVYTIQLQNSVDLIQFCGSNPLNLDHLAVLSQSTSSFSLAQFDCLKLDSLDSEPPFELISGNLRDALNQCIISHFNFDPTLFNLEFTDDIAENNLTAGFTMEINPNGNDMVHVDGMGESTTDMSDTSSVASSHQTTGDGGMGDFDDDEITSPFPHQQEQLAPAPTTAAESFAALITPLRNEDDGEIEIRTSALDDPAHPRLWRVTSILNCQFSSDFTIPNLSQILEQHQQLVQQQKYSQQQLQEVLQVHLPNQLFVTAATAGGGVIMATVTRTIGPNNRPQLTIPKLIPALGPYTAHSSSICDSTLILGDLLTPVLLTGGRDGRLALSNTHAEHNRIQTQFPAIFATMQKELEEVDAGPKKHKKTRRGAKNASGATKSTATTLTSGLDAAVTSGVNPASGKVSAGKRTGPQPQRRVPPPGRPGRHPCLTS